MVKHCFWSTIHTVLLASHLGNKTENFDTLFVLSVLFKHIFFIPLLFCLVFGLHSGCFCPNKANIEKFNLPEA